MSSRDAARVRVAVARPRLVDLRLGACILSGPRRGMLVARDTFLWWMRRRDGRLPMASRPSGAVAKSERLAWLVSAALSRGQCWTRSVSISRGSLVFRHCLSRQHRCIRTYNFSHISPVHITVHSFAFDYCFGDQTHAYHTPKVRRAYFCRLRYHLASFYGG